MRFCAAQLACGAADRAQSSARSNRGLIVLAAASDGFDMSALSFLTPTDDKPQPDLRASHIILRPLETSELCDAQPDSGAAPVAASAASPLDAPAAADYLLEPGSGLSQMARAFGELEDRDSDALGFARAVQLATHDLEVPDDVDEVIDLTEHSNRFRSEDTDAAPHPSYSARQAYSGADYAQAQRILESATDPGLLRIKELASLFFERRKDAIKLTFSVQKKLKDLTSFGPLTSHALLFHELAQVLGSFARAVKIYREKLVAKYEVPPKAAASLERYLKSCIAHALGEDGLGDLAETIGLRPGAEFVAALESQDVAVYKDIIDNFKPLSSALYEGPITDMENLYHLLGNEWRLLKDCSNRANASLPRHVIEAFEQFNGILGRYYRLEKLLGDVGIGYLPYEIAKKLDAQLAKCLSTIRSFVRAELRLLRLVRTIGCVNSSISKYANGLYFKEDDLPQLKKLIERKLDFYMAGLALARMQLVNPLSPITFSGRHLRFPRYHENLADQLVNLQAINSEF